MIFDSTNKFSSGQAVTATANSDNVIDLGVALRDVGVGNPVSATAHVDEDFAGLTTLSVSVQSAEDEGFSSGLRTLVTTRAVPVGELTSGYQFPLLHLPAGITGRYLRLNYTVVGTGTAGTLSAGVVAGPQRG